MAAFLPILAAELDPSGMLVGLAVSAFFLSRIFIELPAGIISDRIGRRKLLIIGIGLSAVGALFCTQANSIHLLIVGRVFWGLGSALYFMNNAALIIDLFDPNIRGRAIGIFNSIEFLGSFLGAPVGGFLVGIISYKNVFYFALGLILGSFTLAFSSKNLKAIKGNQNKDTNLSIKWTFTCLQNLSVIIICMISFFRMLIMQGIFATIFQLYLNKELSFSIAIIGLIMSLRTAGHIVATTVSGFLADIFDKRTILTIGFLLDAGCLAAFTIIFNLETFLAVAFLGGFGEGLVFTSLIVLLSEIVHPSVRGRALGLYRTFMDLGGFIGPIFFMFVYTILSSHTAFLVASSINVLNIFLLTLSSIKSSSKTSEKACQK